MSSPNARFGWFAEPLKAEFLVEPGEDYRVRLLEPLTFVDVRGPAVEYVTVPAGTVVDGATIPAWAWALVGAPLSGDFRRAAVLHDYECVVRATASWQVHRRFYRAMRADGVGRFRAAVMYLAARWFGPSFSAYDFDNVSTLQR